MLRDLLLEDVDDDGQDERGDEWKHADVKSHGSGHGQPEYVEGNHEEHHHHVEGSKPSEKYIVILRLKKIREHVNSGE
jgi:hypothetical protein